LFKLADFAVKNITGVEAVKVCASDPVAAVQTNFFISTCIPNSYSSTEGLALYPNVASLQYTNETNISGTAFDSRLSWIGGAFVLWDDPDGGMGDFRTNRQAKSLFVANFTTAIPRDRSQALYTQGTYSITDTFKFTGGVRYTWDQRALQFGQIVSRTNGLAGTYSCATPGLAATTPTEECLNTFKNKYGDFGYNFDAEWQATPRLMVYLATRKGYKSGGFNSTSTSSSPQYNPEILKDVELGEKFQWGSGDLRGVLNAAIFYGWYSGIQQQLSAVVNNQATVIVTNAGNAGIRGLELESAMTLFDHLTLSLYYSFLQGRYDACPANPTPGSCFMDGGVNVTESQFLGTARNTFNATARYTVPLGDAGNLALQGTYYIRSATPYAADNILNYEAIAPGYNIVNARVEWENVFSKKINVAVYGNNLGNKNYVTSGYGLGGLIGTDSRIYGDPRTYGAEVYLKF
jgi:iron complex outermembrane receptor protein